MSAVNSHVTHLVTSLVAFRAVDVHSQCVVQVHVDRVLEAVAICQLL
jgi:hypothetical protein